MKSKYKELYGIDINLKGYMQRYESIRQIHVKEDRMKSSEARVNTDYEQALDWWIELYNDHEHLLKEQKAIKGSKADMEKLEAIQAREDMISRFAKKQNQQFEDKESGIDVGDIGNVDTPIMLSDTEVNLPKPFASRQQITNQILNHIKESDQDTLHSLQKMQD
ncbi:hypothetical protein L873DRAFT_1795676 [Choiromyces venosus 120613-1]|uniref:Uncharacterized protein n=1 Tax=Choiromyces venosus 120613-1 TaxID=1336337 RepID=A0A3N4J0Q4_9PEZI|nr:hypothetical protein L873DRAFT_1795676 [Choiromyces venosus 120613-1]